MWLQIVDGWAQPQGEFVFGKEYIEDAKRGFEIATLLLR